MQKLSLSDLSSLKILHLIYFRFNYFCCRTGELYVIAVKFEADKARQRYFVL